MTARFGFRNISRKIHSERNYFVYFYRWSKETKFPANLFAKKHEMSMSLTEEFQFFYERDENVQRVSLKNDKTLNRGKQKVFVIKPTINTHRVHESPSVRSAIQYLKILDELASFTAAATADGQQQPVPESLRLRVAV